MKVVFASPIPRGSCTLGCEVCGHFVQQDDVRVDMDYYADRIVPGIVCPRCEWNTWRWQALEKLNVARMYSDTLDLSAVIQLARLDLIRYVRVPSEGLSGILEITDTGRRWLAETRAKYGKEGG